MQRLNGIGGERVKSSVTNINVATSGGKVSHASNDEAGVKIAENHTKRR